MDNDSNGILGHEDEHNKRNGDLNELENGDFDRITDYSDHDGNADYLDVDGTGDGNKGDQDEGDNGNGLVLEKEATNGDGIPTYLGKLN